MYNDIEKRAGKKSDLSSLSKQTIELQKNQLDRAKAPLSLIHIQMCIRDRDYGVIVCIDENKNRLKIYSCMLQVGYLQKDVYKRQLFEQATVVNDSKYSGIGT